jgi:hypothetical protein
MRALDSRPIVLAVAIALLLSCFANDTQAQDDEGEPSSRDVIRFGTVVVHGRAYKPNAFFVNTRRSLVYQDLELRESFVSEITAPIEEGEF